ncbi:methionine aminopeptidase 1D, mitochondrial-like isoform X1 [Artemia franciscana]|uniref:methionine aminopeptidase 1D, mitochondrial-like isoform X1 n=1 Tax=Artemia franciscana TaxID=6661 RepID=UPI0032DAF4C5
MLKVGSRFFRSVVNSSNNSQILSVQLARFASTTSDAIQRRYIRQRRISYDLVRPHIVSPQLEVPSHILCPEYANGNEPFIPYDVEIKSLEQVHGVLEACKIARKVLDRAIRYAKEGVTTDMIDKLVHNEIILNGAYPSPLNYKGFPKSICTSVNDVACHGIPDNRALKSGDMLTVDVTVYHRGYHGDCSETVIIGKPDSMAKKLLEVTEKCLYVGIGVCRPGQAIKKIGEAIENCTKEYNLRVIPAFTGHGIGSFFHGPPEICHFKNNEPGEMFPGMIFTVEPVITDGSGEVIVLDDGWTAVTADGSRAAQFEHTILITNTGAEILTI